ncbi:MULTISPECIES: SPOR domain-containing protein [Paraburkholderia]|nr:MULTISPECIES: SPOR domain-containing protein [Paraburkholderia]MBB2978179.1 cell division protein FtsN [Paraburkholderia tropica]MBB2998115.1 cell division protein FtsN [Paraburkholderia tropica]MBB6317138.1 cell division protein FtsN [Paraburkholderia tropica]MBN3813606.1 cell division protein [Paraburkholderia sp. Ac-20347]OBR49587.1 cell division protein [Paraburkholderia tropica]
MAKPRRTTKQQSKQSGGTFLGVVLGLIVGLAIAVVVALYITRSPTPFVSKVAPPAASDASQSEQYDPNRPLQGKTPGQPVTPQAAQSTPPNTAPGQTTNQSQSSGMLDEPQIVEVPPSGSTDNSANNAANNGVAVAPKPSTGNTADTTQPAKKPQPSSQPAQQLANNQPQKSPNAIPAPNAAKPAQPGSGAPSAADANTGYFLQVGAYKTSSDAEQQRARLAFQGFESKVTQRDAGGITYYRVRIGPFSKFDDMNSTRQRLSDAGIDTAVIRFSKQ